MLRHPELGDLPPIRLSHPLPTVEHEEEKRPRLSPKVPDPPMLSNGIDPTFRQWEDAIKGKLILNGDHYPSSFARKYYVNSLTE